MSVALVLAPVLGTAIYGTFFAAPRYASETRFSVRSSAMQGGTSALAGTASVLATGNSLGAGGGFVDGWAVSDFLKSRDCMRQLDRKIGLRKYLSYAGPDPFNRLSSDMSEDTLYQAYLATVDVSYNLLEQIDVMKVKAFSPHDSVSISDALVGVAQEFINNMDEKGITDTLKVSKEALSRAEAAALDARGALTDWRVKNGNIDPGAEAVMLLNEVSQIEGELNTAQINLDKIRALDNPEHPMLKPARMQVEALRKRLDDTRARMSGVGDSTEAKRLKAYETLKGAQTFADDNLTAARQNYQQAFTDTLKLQRYLSLITRPVSEQRPSSPDLLVWLIEALAGGFLLAFAVRIGGAVYRDFRHG